MTTPSPQVLTIPAPAPILVDPRLLRWLCVQIMATQRVIQEAGYISERRLQLAIEQADGEYGAFMDQQEWERLKQASEISHEADAKLDNNPFLTTLREFPSVAKPPTPESPCPSSTSPK